VLARTRTVRRKARAGKDTALTGSGKADVEASVYMPTSIELAIVYSD
jgi:hypothetical protein